jgi:hypothetical protein
MKLELYLLPFVEWQNNLPLTSDEMEEARSMEVIGLRQLYYASEFTA